MSRLGQILCALSLFTVATVSEAIEVHGHRGARARYPENTLPAFEYATRIGVDYLEMDLQMTRDGEIVISHDPDINSQLCLNQDGSKVKGIHSIVKMSLNEVKQFDCGSKQNPDFPDQMPVPGERIPEFGELLEMLNQMNVPHAQTVKVQIEIKPPPLVAGIQPETYAQKVVGILSRYGFLDRYFVESDDRRFADAVDWFADLAGRQVQNRLQPVLHVFAFRWIVDIYHHQGKKVIAWTPNRECEWERMIRHRADGITTDDPERLLEYLASRPAPSHQVSLPPADQSGPQITINHN